MEAGSELPLVWIEVELNHGHGGSGPDVMRIENRKKRFDHFREFVVNFQMYAGGEKREGFKHALDMGIFTFTGFQLQPPGDFGVTLRELGAGMAEEAKFSLVIEKEIVAQATAPSPYKRRARLQTRYRTTVAPAMDRLKAKHRCGTQ